MTLGVMQAPFDSSQTGLSAAQFFAALQAPDSKTWYVELDAQRVVPSLSVEEHSPELQVRMQAESPLAQQGLDSQTPAALQISRSPARLQRLAPAVPCGGERIGDFLGRLLPAGFDTEDLMVVLLLLLMSGNCGSGPNMPLITMLIYLFL